MTKDIRTQSIAKIKKLKFRCPGMKKVAIEAIQQGQWGEIGSNLFEIFVCCKKFEPIRKDASMLWDALPKKVRDIIDESK